MVEATLADLVEEDRLDYVFHALAYQSVGKWENDPVAPLSARAAGLISILLWFGIVAAGRWIAYV